MNSRWQHLVPVFVCHRHLLHNLLNVLISRFNSPIHLRPVRRRVVMLYLELFTEFGDHLIIEICTIVRNDPLWYTISADQIVPNKLCHNILGYSSKGSCLNPLHKVINCYQDEMMPVRCSRYDLIDHVDGPHHKGPQSCQYV